MIDRSLFRLLKRKRAFSDHHVLVGIDQSFSNYAMVKFVDGIPTDRCVFHTGDPTAKKNKGKTYGKWFESPVLQLDYMYQQVIDKVAEWNPHDIAMEGLAFSATGNMERQLGALYFGIQVSLHRELDYSYNNLHVVTPTQCKSLAREFMIGDDRYSKEGGIIVTLRSGKRKLNPMKEKKLMLKALENTSHSWLVDGYTRDGLVAAKIRETGLEDIPDAFFMGLHCLENVFKHKEARPITGEHM